MCYVSLPLQVAREEEVSRVMHGLLCYWSGLFLVGRSPPLLCMGGKHYCG